MSSVRAYVMWRAKEGVEISKETVTYFSPGGYSFIHKSGKEVNFDFEESYGDVVSEDGLLDFNHRNIDNDFITEALKYDGHKELIQEEYDINFFRGGSFNVEKNEMHCCMDFKVDDEIIEEIDFRTIIEPVYLAVFDPYNPDDIIELYNTLTEKEYKKYCCASLPVGA